MNSELLTQPSLYLVYYHLLVASIINVRFATNFKDFNLASKLASSWGDCQSDLYKQIISLFVNQYETLTFILTWIIFEFFFLLLLM